MKLVEQSWDLRVRINRLIEREREIEQRSSYQHEKMERLSILSNRAYARYLRRLKNHWSKNNQRVLLGVTDGEKCSHAYDVTPL